MKRTSDINIEKHPLELALWRFVGMSVKAVSVGWERVKSDCIGLLNEWKVRM